MSSDRRRDDLLIGIALTEFSVHYEQADPELSEHAWQLAADRLLEHNVESAEIVDELGIERHLVAHLVRREAGDVLGYLANLLSVLGDIALRVGPCSPRKRSGGTGD